MLRILLALLLLILATPFLARAGEIPVHAVTALKSYPHDPQAMTQGLLFHQGRLYESTGGYGRSSLRLVDPETGAVLRRRDLPADLFGEGLALHGGVLYQLTWRSGRHRLRYGGQPPARHRQALAPRLRDRTAGGGVEAIAPHRKCC